MSGSIRIGDRFWVLNKNTFEHSLFIAHEAFTHGPGSIVYGTLQPHEVRLPQTHGTVNVAERAACPVFLLNASTELVEAATEAFHGLPLYAVETVGQINAYRRGAQINVLPILGADVYPGMSPLAGVDGFKHRAIILIDSFVHFVETGQVPEHFTEGWARRARGSPSEIPTAPFGGAPHFEGLGGLIIPPGVRDPRKKFDSN